MLKVKKTILVSPNSFKDCAGSLEIANFIEEFLKDKYEIVKAPISDGGDGFLDVIKYYLDCATFNFTIRKPYSAEKIKIPVMYDFVNQTIYIESALVLGLNTIPDDKRNILINSSKGLGDLILAIKDKVVYDGLKVNHVVIGLGGTGVSDMGIGALSRLGLQLMQNKQELDAIPFNMAKADEVIFKPVYIPFTIEFITDVSNPLLGDNGANYVYAKQKGASPDEIKILEFSFKKIVDLLNYPLYQKLSGAGGGISASFEILLHSKVTHSHVLIEKLFSKFVVPKNINIIITGEGKFDKQTLYHKGVKVLVDKFIRRVDEVIIICGILEDKDELNLDRKIKVFELSKYFDTKEESMSNWKKGISNILSNEL